MKSCKRINSLLKEIVLKNLFKDIRPRFTLFGLDLPGNSEELLEKTDHLLSKMFTGDDRENAEAFLKVALMFDNEGFIDEAIFYYTLSIVLHPSTEAINNLASGYAEKGRFQDALWILLAGEKHFSDNRDKGEDPTRLFYNLKLKNGGGFKDGNFNGR